MQFVVFALTVLVLALLVIAAGVAWYYAGEIGRMAFAVGPPPPPFDLTVTAVDGDSITLRPMKATNRSRGDWRRPGRYGIMSTEGKGTVGEILRHDGDEVSRELLFSFGSIRPGDQARLWALAYPGDPLSIHGLAFDEVTFESDIGRLGAWHVAGTSPTWTIVVHGRAVDRAEGLKVLPVLAALGLPTLLIQYRNDPDVAGAKISTYEYGLSEWRDLEAAVRYALDHGAKGIALIGNSMGGSIVLSFLYRSKLADRVRGVVIDSPVLDFADLIDFGAERRNFFKPVAWLGKVALAVRSRTRFRDIDYLSDAGALSVPILLFHGDADPIVHVRNSDRLAAARPDLVTYLRLEGVGHLRGWNACREAYERALADFLTPLT